MRIINRYIRGILRVSLVLWFIFVILHCVFTGRTYLWNWFGSLPTLFFVTIPLFFVVVEFFRKKRNWIYISMMIVSLVLGATQADIHLFSKKNNGISSHPNTSVKVFNWNTALWDQDKNREQFFRFLKDQNADIYILQEYLRWMDPGMKVTPENIQKFNLFPICSVVPGFPVLYQGVNDQERLRREFPGYDLAIHNQFVILSRFPIENSYPDYSEQYAVADINIEGRLVRIYNVHIILHLEMDNPLNPNFYEGLQRRFAARHLAFQNLKADIQNWKLDYLIAGDFNSTKAMGVMNELFDKNIDVVTYSGEWFPVTFTFKGLNLWRFDYQLIGKASRNIRVKSYQNMDPQGLSDHNPQLLVLDIQTGSPQRQSNSPLKQAGEVCLKKP